MDEQRAMYYKRNASRSSSSLAKSLSVIWEDDGTPLPDNEQCAICGARHGDLQRWASIQFPRYKRVVGHHIKPLRCGGKHCASNTVFLCESCHLSLEHDIRRRCKVCDGTVCRAHEAVAWNG